MLIDSHSACVTLDPCAADFYQNPYPVYRKWRDNSPVFFWKNYGFWCFSRYDAVNALLRDRRFGRQILHVASREMLGWADVPHSLKAFYDFEQHSLLELEPPVHTRLRGLVSRAFLSRQVERLRPKITELTHWLIDRFEAQGTCDLLTEYATPIPVIVICELLGVPLDMSQQLLAWSHDMVAMYMARRDEAVEQAAVAATVAFSDYMRRHIDKRRSSLNDDLLSALIRAESEGQKLSPDELLTTAVLLLNAGHEATVHAIGNGIHTVLKQNYKGPITEQLVDETLRFDPPLHLFTRYALEDLNFAGVDLKKGDKVGLLLASANRDDEKFPQAEHFIPSRDPNPLLSFGAGIHFCIGAPLARLELQIAFDTLFQRLPSLALNGHATYRNSYHFHGIESLQVRF